MGNHPVTLYIFTETYRRVVFENTVFVPVEWDSIEGIYHIDGIAESMELS